MQNLYVDNCSFVDASAQYGGAIYAIVESLEFKNLFFWRTHAIEEGGAIVIDTAWMAPTKHLPAQG